MVPAVGDVEVAIEIVGDAVIVARQVQ